MVSSDMSEVNIYSEKYLSFTYFNHFLRTKNGFFWHVWGQY